MESLNTQDNLTSVQELADMLNIHVRQVQRLAKQNIIPKSIKGKYNLSECVKNYLKYLGETNTDALSIDAKLEKAKLLKAKAIKADIELRLLQGKLIDIKEVEQHYTDLVLNFRAKMLSIPRKLARRLVNINSVFIVEDILEQEIHIALTELSQE